MTCPQVVSSGALGLSVLVLAACGSGQSVDEGGFTGAQRKAAQAALDLLQDTGIPRRVVAISYQDGQAPSTCSVLPKAGAPGVFQLLVAWDPTKPDYVTQPKTVLQATIGAASARADRFQVSSYGGHGGKPEPIALRATVARTMLAKPAEQCEALENGGLELRPS